MTDVPLRRGLPRVSGGDAWPPEGTASVRTKAPAGAAAGAGETPTVATTPVAGDAAESVAVSEAEVVSGTVGVEGAAESVAREDTASAQASDEPAAQPAAGAAAGVAAGAGVAGAGIAAASNGGAASEDASVPLRRGLPRQSGGEPWPPEGLAPAGVKSASAVATSSAASSAASDGAESPEPVGTAETAAPTAATSGVETSDAEVEGVAPAAGVAAAGAGVAAGAAAAGPTELSDVPLRRGLPRTSGGDPWPPEGFAPATRASAAAGTSTPAGAAAPASDSATAPASAAPAGVAGTAAAGTAAADTGDAAASASTTDDKPAGSATADGASAAGDDAATAKPAARSGLPKTRTGLPKSTGPDTGKPGDKPAGRTGLPKTSGPASKPAEKPAAQKPAATSSAGAASATKADAKPTETAKPAAASAAKTSTATKTAEKPKTADKPAKPTREPIMIGSKSLGQWVKLGGLGLGGLIVAAGILILAARGVTTLPGVPEFLERYPGEYHLPDFVDPGFPAWARWTHFLNLFFMVLIIRSGLQVRHQQKPPAYYTPKKGGKKISINLWLHTSLDVLWLVNGVVFVVLLFVSGHWARIVPTSWEVFPNALSAMLQYGTLEWPMEDAWVNYNALQQLMYFIVVFIAAPLAAITGVRMSEWWPKNATTLNKIYPAPLARAIHFPTMLFFVFFILVHVFLVFTTGLRQNLGYMFAGTNVLGWAGVIWFIVAMVVVVAGWFAARPLLLAPIANLFGRVSSR